MSSRNVTIILEVSTVNAMTVGSVAVLAALTSTNVTAILVTQMLPVPIIRAASNANVTLATPEMDSHALTSMSVPKEQTIAMTKQHAQTMPALSLVSAILAGPEMVSSALM